MSKPDDSTATKRAGDATRHTSVRKAQTGFALGKVLGGILLLLIVGKCTMVKIEEWNMSPAEMAAYEAKIQARFAAEEAEKLAKAKATTAQTAPSTAPQGNSLIERCASAAVAAGFRTASCANFFMTVCVTEQSRTAMAQAVEIGKMQGVIPGSKFAQCGGGAFTPQYGQAFEAALAKDDKF